MGNGDKTTLLFLHGIGDGDPDRSWQDVLEKTLRDCGYPGLESVDVYAPRYAYNLNGVDEPKPVPSVTAPKLGKVEAANHRRFVETNTAGLEFMLGQQIAKDQHALFDSVFSVGTSIPVFGKVKNYVENEEIRGTILTRILAGLPAEGSIVIVAHSLGTVIAADLLLRLPQQLKVRGIVTIGSPLGQKYFAQEQTKKSLLNPPKNAPWWVNFWDRNDPIVLSRSVSTALPWVLDLGANSGKFLHKAHASLEYLGKDNVARVIGFALFGSLSKDLVLAHADDEKLTEYEFNSLVILSFAHLVARSLKDEHARRYLGALRQVQRGILQRVIEANADISEGRDKPRVLPTRIARLAFDPMDAEATLPEPVTPHVQDRMRAAEVLIGLMFQNVIAPFEIEVSRQAVSTAVRGVAMEMGLKSSFGDDVIEATKEAERVLHGAGGVNLVKVGAIGAGALVLAAATGGLALAISGPALVGAAAITSGLAAFGPGGMIGGIITAGTLMSVGSGTLALGISSPGTSPQAVEQWLVKVIALASLRKKYRSEFDTEAWSALIQIEAKIRREHERIDEFSDPKSESVTAMNRKLTALGRAVKHLASLRGPDDLPLDISQLGS